MAHSTMAYGARAVDGASEADGARDAKVRRLPPGVASFSNSETVVYQISVDGGNSNLQPDLAPLDKAPNDSGGPLDRGREA